MSALTGADIDTLVAIERTCSILSLTSCVFVLVTFTFSDAFRQRAINRMIFYATFGNLLTNVATMMTRTYVNDVNSAGCQLQAFLLQLFNQSDAYWALAMAVNVYLTFYHMYDARMLRKMEMTYFLCCYGIPFVPAFTFIFVSTEHEGRPYGNAVLWCWLTSEWNVYRIATFYAPVWVAIILTMSIYIRAGRQIYLNRRKIMNFRSIGTGKAVGSRPPSPAHTGFPAFKTTEVVQTTEIIKLPAPVAAAGTIPSCPAPLRDPNVSYTVNIFADTDANAHHAFDNPNNPTSSPNAIVTSVAGNNLAVNTPNSSNAPGGGVKRGGTLLVDVPTTTTTATTTTNAASVTADANSRRRNYNEFNSATWSYTKCAILFFSVLLITWIPSSGNRVYTLIHGGAVSRPLLFASGFVLPLQGFWNAIIYIVTSWAACKSYWRQCVGALGGIGEWVSAKRKVVGRGRWVKMDEFVDRMGLGKTKQAGLREPAWMERRRKKGESASMEDLTAEGRVKRALPV